MKVELNRNILFAVCALLSLAITSNSHGQVHSILNVPEGEAPKSIPVRVDEGNAVAAQVAQLEAIDRSVHDTSQDRVMQVNQPSSLDALESGTDFTTATEQLPSAPMVSISQLNEVQYGAPIPAGVSVFEIQNLGGVAARDVAVEIEAEHPATIESVEPKSTVFAQRRARIRLQSLDTGTSKRILVRAQSGTADPVQFTAKISMETVQRFGSSTASAKPIAFTKPTIPTSQDKTHQPKFVDDIGYEQVTARHQKQVQRKRVNQLAMAPVPPSSRPQLVSLNKVPRQKPVQQTVLKTNDDSVPQDAVILKLETADYFLTGTPYRVFATVQNPTSATIKNIKVVMNNPGQLRMVPGYAAVQQVSELGPRHTAKFEFAVYGSDAGEAELNCEATGEFSNVVPTDEDSNQIVVSTSRPIDLYQPSVRGDFNGPEMIHVGTEGEYSIEIINETGVELPVADVLLSTPNGLLITVLDRIAHQRGNEQINWKIKKLQPGESEVIKFKARAIESGMQIQEINISINEQVFANGTCQTNVLQPSKMSVVINDPVQAVAIGEVTNLGMQIKNMNEYDSEIVVTVKLPKGVDALNADSIESVKEGVVTLNRFLISRMTETQIEIPVVGSSVGGRPVEVTVNSITTESSCKANKNLLFINPQQEIAVRPTEVRPIEQQKKPRIVGQRSMYLDFSKKR